VPFETDGLASLSWAIGVIVVLLWAALWALRRARPSGVMSRNVDCTILRSLSLGPRERLLVVSIGTKQLVLGVGNGAVSLLAELSDPLTPIAPANAGFGDVMRKARERWHAG
jgi:flagellar protein FliO/FliZ